MPVSSISSPSVLEGPEREIMASYLLVTCLYNEEDNVDGLFDSIEEQVLPPGLWLVIDDGSTDGTYDRIAQRSRMTPLAIKVWRGDRKAEPDYDTIGLAIRKALLTLDEETYGGFEYFCLLGADSRVGPDYFSSITDRMESDLELGMASGVVVTRTGREKTRPDIPRGSGSSTRASVWRSISREDIPDFDIDAFYTAKTRIMGLKTRMFDDLEVFQTRPTTTLSPYRKGQLMAIHWYNPIVVAAHAVRIILGGSSPIPLIVGYAQGLRGKRIQDDDVKRYFGRRIVLDLIRMKLR